MRILAVLALGIVACRFDPRGLAATGDDGGAVIDAAGDGDAIDGAAIDAAIDGAAIDAAMIDAAMIDAAVDAPIDAAVDAPIDAAVDAPIDARTCPTAPAGCTLFGCTGSPSCYYLCTTQATWANANMRCATAGLGCLATIDDAAENTCLATVAQPSFPDLIWFGWHQSPTGSEPGGGWGWACGASGFVAGNWGNGEPNNSGGNEDCGAMVTGGGWIDGDCGVSFRYVCELP